MEPETPTDKPERGTGKGDEKADPNRTVKVELQVPPTDRQEKETRRKKQIRFEYIRFGVELLTLGALLWYATVNHWLYKQTKIGAEAAKSSADAAQTQAAVSKQAMELDMRAWVFPSFGDVTLDCAEDKRVDRCTIFVAVGFKNAGKSPAFNMGYAISWAWAPTSFSQIQESGTAIAPPGPEAAVVTPKFLVMDRVAAAAVQKGQRLIYVGGLIFHDDPVATGRSTRWCARYNPFTKDLVFCDTGADGAAGMVLK